MGNFCAKPPIDIEADVESTCCNNDKCASSCCVIIRETNHKSRKNIKSNIVI
jgi:hypothetical protein